VNDVVVFKTADDVRYRIDLAYETKELVAKTFALASPFHESRDIDELNGCRHNSLGFENGRDVGKALVWHLHDTFVVLFRAERIVLGRHVRLRNRVENGRFADVRQPYDSAIKSHANGN